MKLMEVVEQGEAVMAGRATADYAAGLQPEPLLRKSTHVWRAEEADELKEGVERWTRRRHVSRPPVKLSEENGENQFLLRFLFVYYVWKIM